MSQDLVVPPAASAPGDACLGLLDASRPTLRLTMVGWMVAGIRTHYENVRNVVRAAQDIQPREVPIHPWRAGGAIEGLPLLPQRMRSTMRTYAGVAPLFRAGRVDVVWSQVLNPLAPYLFTKAAVRHVPVVYDIDCTPRSLASFGEHYAGQVAGPPFKRHAVDALFTACAKRCASVVCWSSWAACSFIDEYGVPPERIKIIPPGVDTAWWAPPPGQRQTAHRTRLLFVGADFARKGGDLLLDVWRSHFADECELHLVTRGDVTPEPGVVVYRDFSPNDPGLRSLYHSCDALVLPTRADCFSLASIEAMAAGLPVITTNVGGIPDIVDDGTTGYLLAPNDGAALRAAIERLVQAPQLQLQLGAAGRRKADSRFDAARNTWKLLALLRDVAGLR